MTKYWLIRAGEKGDLWDYWKEGNFISVGWDIGEISKLSTNQIKEKINEKALKNPNFTKRPSYVLGILQKFTEHKDSNLKMKNGDKVLILGEGTIMDIATINNYEYRKKGLDHSSGHTYFRKVKFEKIGPLRLINLPEEFRQKGKNAIHLVGTLSKYNISDQKFNELLNLMKNFEPIEEFSSKFDFSEKDIQDYIEKNYLELDNNIRRIEREYQTKVGFVDFVGYDINDIIYVIEVKIGTANDSAIGQLLGYLNAIKEESGKETKGILAAEGFSKRAKYTAKSMGIRLMKFKVKLNFQDE
jgi:hypothetical protein